MHEYIIYKLMSKIIYKEESYRIIGICFEVHNNLGPGFLEVVYKDALEYEFRKAGIPYSREKEYIIRYKDIILPHKYNADFIVYDKIVLEVKGKKAISEEHLAQTLNYLKVSGCRLGLVVNFGQLMLQHNRVVF